VQDPADGVVDRLGLAEALVAALVGDDPEAGAGQRDDVRVDGPRQVAQRAPGVAVYERAARAERRVDERGRVGDRRDEDDILKDVERRLDRAALEAVLRDDAEQLLDLRGSI